MRNYVDELKPQVFLPLKYLDELKNVPESKLSLRLNSEVVSHDPVSLHSSPRADDSFKDGKPC